MKLRECWSKENTIVINSGIFCVVVGGAWLSQVTIPDGAIFYASKNCWYIISYVYFTCLFTDLNQISLKKLLWDTPYWQNKSVTCTLKVKHQGHSAWQVSICVHVYIQCVCVCVCVCGQMANAVLLICKLGLLQNAFDRQKQGEIVCGRISYCVLVHVLIISTCYEIIR